MIRTPRRRRHALSVLVLAVLSLLLSVVPANAAASTDPNPQTSGCAASMSHEAAIDVNDGGQEVATVHLRYSRSCGTQWVNAYFLPGYSAEPSVWLQNAGGNLYTAYSDGGSACTYQLFDMANWVGCGGAHIYHNGVHVTWAYVGCF
ncbi:DUF2690 domain-containing protein [Umezawaea sp. Da 62-37]|uniref:DUF2690 domain-containing protein n=1 Tax=Umezawaea sp. Da 62-37 TaxID=3075927 RepID=UPI0028F7411C|nr:DUF2690 domain-containing protein [Umezawaea sp. Da 62-37]WNV85003.1 DUF2690 domain-containing protein [Umezawaea sp. Da 62-37]